MAGPQDLNAQPLPPRAPHNFRAEWGNANIEMNTLQLTIVAVTAISTSAIAGTVACVVVNSAPAGTIVGGSVAGASVGVGVGVGSGAGVAAATAGAGAGAGAGGLATFAGTGGAAGFGAGTGAGTGLGGASLYQGSQTAVLKYVAGTGGKAALAKTGGLTLIKAAATKAGAIKVLAVVGASSTGAVLGITLAAGGIWLYKRLNRGGEVRLEHDDEMRQQEVVGTA